MGFTTGQLFQARENSTSPVSILASGATEEVEVRFISVANTTASEASVRIFHDNDGTVYDESTAIAWDIVIPPGAVWDREVYISLSDETGNLAYRSSVANALTITGYGSVTTP